MGAVVLLTPAGPRLLLNAVAGPPAPNICDECFAPLQVGDFPFCKGNPSKHTPPHRRHFTEFEIELDGQVHRITSLQDAARIERESRARYESFDDKGKRRGAPHVFRDFHQNHSNRDVNALASEGVQAPRPHRTNSRGEPLGYAGVMRRRD